MIHVMSGFHNGVFPMTQFQTCTLTPRAARLDSRGWRIPLLPKTGAVGMLRAYGRADRQQLNRSFIKGHGHEHVIT
jgi:hypothetical protein